MATLARRSVRAAIAAALALALSGVAAASASANPGSVYFSTNNGFGICLKQLNGMFAMASPNLVVYGMSSTDRVRVWFQLVDDYGRAQTQWGDRGMARATGTTPATYGSVQISPLAPLGQYSRIQFFIAWYASSGPGGTQTPVYTATVTLQQYKLYSYGGALPGLKYDGMSTACFR